MTRDRTYAVIGAGALGSYYGARLSHAGCDVHFLLHSDYYHVKRHGLRIVSKKEGDFSLSNPWVYPRPEDMPRCDVALIALKTTANAALPAILPHVLAPGGVALVMQNGLAIEPDVAAIVGPERVMGALAFLCCNKLGPGDVLHIDYGNVRLGEHSAGGEPRGITPRMLAIADDFRRAGIPVELEADLVLARWKKLVWNIPYNGLAVLLDATTDRLMDDPSSRALCIALMHEVRAGAAAQGRVIEPGFVDQMVDYTDKMEPYLPSMKLDYDARREVEVEAIYGNPLRAAAAAGVSLPRIESLYHELKFLDARNRR
jgi:2-dehydropantoate 2-reductase